MNILLQTTFAVLLLTAVGVWPPTAHADNDTSDAQAAQIAAIEPGTSEPVYHDLVFSVASADKPFYTDGTFMLGDKIIKVEQGALPGKEMVAFDDKADRIVVSNDKAVAEADKGAALIQLMDAMSIQQIEPAAGPAK